MMIVNIISVQKAPGPNLGSESKFWYENQRVNNSNTEVTWPGPIKIYNMNETFSG